MGNYLKENSILELENIEDKDELDFSLNPKQILVKFKAGINKFLDNENCVNCYQSEMFGDYVFKYCIYIDNFIDNNDSNNAFVLVTNFIDCIDNIYIYNQDEVEDINEILINYLVVLAKGFGFYNKIKEYLSNKYQRNKMDELGKSILDKIIATIKTKENAEEYILLLKQIKVESYLDTTIKDYIKQLKSIE